MTPTVQQEAQRKIQDLQRHIDVAIKRWMLAEIRQWIIPRLDDAGLVALARKVEERIREREPELNDTPGLIWILVAGVDTAKRGRLFFASEVTLLGAQAG